MDKKLPRVGLMEKLRNKKILSQCSKAPCSLYLRPGDCISSVEKVDDCSTKHSSNSATKKGSANTFLRTPSTLKITLVEDNLVPLRNETCLTPNKGEAEATLNGDQIPGQVTPPIDFSVLSAADFGITPESFTLQQKGESKSLLKKFRRRSTIGARGSPENNSLIKYIACQKRTMMEKSSSQVSPFKRRSVLLKDKMAAFQSSFKPLEETEERLNHTHVTPKNGGSGAREQSTFGQGWHLESKSFAVEEHLNSHYISGERTSAALPMCNTVSPLQESLVFQGIQSQCINEEFSSSFASQQSCKKVRFAEKESLEIFDQSKPPITPLQKGQLPSSVLYHSGTCLRSVLKKPQEHFDDSGSREQSEAPLAFETCGLQQIESNTRPVNETEEDCKDLDTNVLAALLLVHTPLLRGAGPRSPSGSRNYSAITPTKQPLPQPNFDSEDDLPPASSTAVHTTECAVNSDLEETNSSPDPQATCSRITRSSRKRKLVREVETDIHLPTEGPSKRASTKKVRKPNKAEKANSKKTPASRYKVFGKRRRKKKEQKALYGQRETVSKKPLLSPIPEMKEDLSFASYRSTPRSQISIMDYSDSSDACVEYMDKTSRKENGALQIPTVDNSGLNLSLDLVKENALPDIKLVSSQLQDDDDMTVGENRFSWDPPEKDSPAELKSTINTNQQILESDCSSKETKILKELEFLGADATGKKISSRGELDLAGDSALELRSEDEVNRNFKKFPRRNRRFSHYLPNIDENRSKTPGNNSCVPRSPLEELLPTQTVNDSVLLTDLQHSIEESFRNVPYNDQKRVRRSMRRLKDAENSGLVWINLPADSTTNILLGCANKAQRQTCPSSLEELACLCQKQDSFHVLLPMKEEKENVPVAMGPCRSKAGRRRKSICALGLEENQTVVLPPQRNRRASLGYRSDKRYRQDSEVKKLLTNQPTNQSYLSCCL